MVDPFTLLYNKMVSVLKAHAGNRYSVIDWNSTRNPQPDVAASSDVPEWQLRPSGANVQVGSSSCASVVTRDFTLTLITGTKVLGKWLLPGEWALMSALYDLQYSALESLKWEDRSFVERVEVTGSVSGITDPEGSRQIVGWASSWTIRVHMTFSASDLGAS